VTWTFDDGGRSAAGFTGKTGDCVTRAIAIATGLDYADVYAALNMAENGKRRRGVRRGSARTGINKDISRDYLISLGWTWTPTMHIGSGCTVHLKAGELPSGRLVVVTSRHLCAVIDGVIHDRYDPSRDGTRCVYGYYQKVSK
jgi:hypothetical protein